jgi:hypothetical protein
MLVLGETAGDDSRSVAGIGGLIMMVVHPQGANRRDNLLSSIIEGSTHVKEKWAIGYV